MGVVDRSPQLGAPNGARRCVVVSGEDGRLASAEADRCALDAVAAGEVDGLSVLAGRHGQALLAYLTGLLGDRLAAEEVVQDTLVAVWRGASGFRGGSSVRTWLFGIARRRAAQSVRGRRLTVVDSSDVALGAIIDTAAGPESTALLRAEVDQVAAAVGGLRPLLREVLLLACVYEMTGPEIAAVLGVPVGTVKSRLSHARAAVSAALVEDLGGDRDGV